MAIHSTLLDRLGLHRPELRAWAMYDWAISSLQTTTMVAVFPIYFVEIAKTQLPGSRATQALATANTVIAILLAITSPVLGAISDVAAAKKRMLGASMTVGALACAGMFLIHHGDWLLASGLFIVAIVAGGASFVFYGALLPHIASSEEVDRVSTAGYALGYIGGGVLLALNLAWILTPSSFGLPSGTGLTESQATLPTRLALASVAVWWLVFSIPLFRRVPEPPRVLEPDERRGGLAIVTTPFVRIATTFHELRGFREALLMLVAFMIYNDGIQTIQQMATAYGTEIGIDRSALISAVLIVQFVGIPCTFLFGTLAGKLGAKRGVFLGLLVYVIVSILGYYMRTALHFYVLAGLVGVVQGGTQALSRSLFASLIPPHKSGEFFGFYSVFERFASIFGPLLFNVTIALTGSSRNAILSVIVFFVLGALLLARVNVVAGRTAAEVAERLALGETS